MSSVTEVNTEEAEVCCASCGITELDDIKLLKECSGGCDLVKYCSDECQEHHSELHEEECKIRKAVLLRDRKLFEQPDVAHLGECPICFLPMPLGPGKSCFYSCCCNLVCDGCVYAAMISSGKDNCSFCREPLVDGDEKNYKRVMERVKANDLNALRKIGEKYYKEQDYDKAIEYFTKAAELGDADAHYNLGFMYRRGYGFEKDEAKGIYHYEKAAMEGHPDARFNLAGIERKNGNTDRAVKHHIIAANLGYEKSMKELWKYYSAGYITKEHLEDTLRTHKAAIDATKSAQRDAAAEVKPKDW